MCLCVCVSSANAVSVHSRMNECINGTIKREKQSVHVKPASVFAAIATNTCTSLMSSPETARDVIVVCSETHTHTNTLTHRTKKGRCRKLCGITLSA